MCSQKHKEGWWRFELEKERREALIVRKEKKNYTKPVCQEKWEMPEGSPWMSHHCSGSKPQPWNKYLSVYLAFVLVLCCL